MRKRLLQAPTDSVFRIPLKVTWRLWMMWATVNVPASTHPSHLGPRLARPKPHLRRSTLQKDWQNFRNKWAQACNPCNNTSKTYNILQCKGCPSCCPTVRQAPNPIIGYGGPVKNRDQWIPPRFANEIDFRSTNIENTMFVFFDWKLKNTLSKTCTFGMDTGLVGGL